ncbi:Lnb N-terminal periplasmic domain-containing protein [Thermophagus sp. OGC60D27]|uniref:Lnb N-terminal periplasmic domain-containing protein n=1 Tax=Thermophagus sp. OGC60D27 TaxID=3458415 RepID=UPI004037E97A
MTYRYFSGITKVNKGLFTLVNFSVLVNCFIKIVLFVGLFFYFSLEVVAQSIPKLSEKASISVLTCAPGDELYSLFGHTAILVSDPEQNIDLTFNYGTFDFGTPFFYLKFSHGNLDYLLSVTSFKNFLREYFISGRSVWKQELNLSLKQKSELFKALMINARPENRAYRYDFFYDNCATRVADIVLAQMPQNLSFGNFSPSENLSFREAIHPFLEKKPWVKLGIDLVLGARADVVTDSLSIMFLPAHLMEQFTGIQFVGSDGSQTELVNEQSMVLDFSDQKIVSHTPVSPALIIWLTTFVLLLLSIAEFFGAINLKIFDIFLFCVTGLAGLVIFYLAFFSSHLVTSPNWNLLWANPLWLVLIKRTTSGFSKLIKFLLQILLLLFFVSLFFTPQFIPNAFVAISLLLFFRSSPVFKWMVLKWGR